MAAPAPVAVSPLIKFARWSFLLAGIAYGSARHATLSKIENSKRAEEERLRPEKEAKLAAEKKRMNRAEQEYLASATGMTLPPDA